VVREFTARPLHEALIEMAEESQEFQLLIQVIDADGASLFLTDGVQPWDWPVDKAMLDRSLGGPVWSNASLEGVSHLVLTETFVSPEGVRYFIEIANSRLDMDKIRRQFINSLNVGMPLVLILGFFAGRLFSKTALAPVEQMRERAETITSANLDDRLVYDGPPDELRRLTDTLNAMLDRIGRTLDRMKNFIADASHELRIPLTGLRGTLEVALRQSRTNDEYKRALENAYAESERMSELVWELLSLARIDAGEIRLEKTDNDVAACLAPVFEEAEVLDVEGRVRWERGPLPQGRFMFDEPKIYRVLINLLENAIRYNRVGGSVRLSAELTSRTLSVSVQDTGIGISAQDQTKIFDRFYRVDKARSREAGGTGLGLSIAQSLVEAHQGVLSVTSVEGVGSEFTMTLPRL
jgi:heavy metal sensor kinase